ncbi:MAG: enolase C-terminal domain-like protein [Spartobacteria bacterium]
MNFFRYALPMSGGGIRKGVLVRLEKPDGTLGWGDAAPLPGWSLETIEAVEAFIKESESENGAPASLVFALESARAGIPKTERHSIPLNALLDGSAQEIFERGEAALASGCECLKIKTAGLSLDELPVLIGRLSALANGRCRFRIDPNRGWNLDSTLSVAESIKNLPVDYIEEPLGDVSMLPDLIQKCPVGIALDETLREITPGKLAAYKGAAALVLKPTLMGGLKVCSDFAQAGASLGMVPGVSACYESGVGIRALGCFALSLPCAAAAGLDTYSRLEQDVLCERLDLRDFQFRPKTPPPDVDLSKLDPL